MRKIYRNRRVTKVTYFAPIRALLTYTNAKHRFLSFMKTYNQQEHVVTTVLDSVFFDVMDRGEKQLAYSDWLNHVNSLCRGMRTKNTILLRSKQAKTIVV